MIRLSDKERAALRAYAARHGRTWKNHLLVARREGKLQSETLYALIPRVTPKQILALKAADLREENPGRKSARRANPSPAKGSMDAFTRAYIEAALWSSTDDDGDSLDRNYSVRDIAPATLTRMKLDARKFQRDNARSLDAGSSSRGGHDFWLTRAGHGAGFWDGDWPEPEATRLTNAAKAFGDNELYVGDDGRIHASITKRRIGKKRPAGAKTSGRKKVSSTKQRNPATKRAKPRKRSKR